MDYLTEQSILISVIGITLLIVVVKYYTSADNNVLNSIINRQETPYVKHITGVSTDDMVIEARKLYNDALNEKYYEVNIRRLALFNKQAEYNGVYGVRNFRQLYMWAPISIIK